MTEMHLTFIHKSSLYRTDILRLEQTFMSSVYIDLREGTERHSANRKIFEQENLMFCYKSLVSV